MKMVPGLRCTKPLTTSQTKRPGAPQQRSSSWNLAVPIWPRRSFHLPFRPIRITHITSTDWDLHSGGRRNLRKPSKTTGRRLPLSRQRAVLYNLAIALAESGVTGQAIGSLRRALIRQPQFPQAEKVLQALQDKSARFLPETRWSDLPAAPSPSENPPLPA